MGKKKTRFLDKPSKNFVFAGLVKQSFTRLLLQKKFGSESWIPH